MDAPRAGRAGAGRVRRPAPPPCSAAPSSTAAREAEDDFRWRGEGVSRLENLSDIVFAFAVSFLVASAEVPGTFAELAESLVGFVAVAFGFAVLLLIWQGHYTFFRRYGLEDVRTIWLNAVPLFLILFVYPLRFVATFSSDLALGRFASWTDVAAVLSLAQIPALQTVYSGGYAAVFGVFALLYRHAGRQAEALGLSPVERVLTAERVALGVTHVGVALAAIALAFALPTRLSFLSFYTYVLLWPVVHVVRRPYQRRYAALTGPG